MEVLEELFKVQDNEYAEFQSKLIPTVNKNSIIGVRLPEIRKLAKKIIEDKQINIFLTSLPHKYYDENMLHSILISKIEDYTECLIKLEQFLPYVDNWAVCDTLSPSIFKKQKKELIGKIKFWAKSKNIYTCRFGIKMLMNHYLDNNFKPEYLSIPADINSNEYYVNMMIAWFYATALAKQWDHTIKYIEKKKLPKWVHNKTIQKAQESYRITDIQKEYLKSFKIK